MRQLLTHKQRLCEDSGFRAILVVSSDAAADVSPTPHARERSVRSCLELHTSTTLILCVRLLRMMHASSLFSA